MIVAMGANAQPAPMATGLQYLPARARRERWRVCQAGEMNGEPLPRQGLAVLEPRPAHCPGWDAHPASQLPGHIGGATPPTWPRSWLAGGDRKSTRLHTSHVAS